MGVYDKCFACGQGGIQTINLKIKPIIVPHKISSNYCSKCGKTLRVKCNSCNGTGKKSALFIYTSLNKPDKYCHECGRELEPPDDTCTACDGEGEVYSDHYCF